MPQIVFKIKKNKNMLSSIKRSFQRLEGQSTSVGYFAEQGKHPVTAPFINQPYSYAALALALETGWFPLNVPEHRIREKLPFMKSIVNLSMKDRRRAVTFTRPFKKWRTNLHNNVSPSLLLNAVGRLNISRAKKVFNNPAFFTQVPINDSPIFETGDLLKKYSYKTSLNKTLKNK